MNISEEDYLKVIYNLTIEMEVNTIKPNHLKEVFGYTIQSILEMIKKLEKKGFLDYAPYQGITLTKQGIQIAKRLIKAHNVWEIFLIEHLKMDWANVHDEAEKLEHAASSTVIEHLYTYLGKPKYDPYGKNIPLINVENNEVTSKKLLSAIPGETFIITSVVDNSDLLHFLNDVQLKLGSNIVVKSKNDFTQNIHVEINQKDIVISYHISKMIYGIIGPLN